MEQFKEHSLRDTDMSLLLPLFFKIFPHPTVWNAGIMAGALAALMDKEDTATYEGWQNSELKWAWFLFLFFSFKLFYYENLHESW